MVIEQTGKAVAATAEAFKSTPLALALLIVNVGFLGFAGYVLGQVSVNASERNKSQMELISQMIKDIRDCRQGPQRSSASGTAINYCPWEP